ncbi:hypothetical protein V3C99_017999 [Haemonchus contortus]|uniref:AAA_12 domain-containing protein n=1 Tax=Haemonchus contortus TaxID=6289 RepID=A0A7I4Z1Z6_HAECO
MICVITLYKEQFLGVELSTVDSVQGREKEVVVILTTKNDFSPNEADFLDDYRRLNVAVSRCRHGQFIFGYAQALRALPMWNRLLNFAESFRSVIRMGDVNRHIYSIHPNLPNGQGDLNVAPSAGRARLLPGSTNPELVPTSKGVSVVKQDYVTHRQLYTRTYIQTDTPDLSII